LQLEVYVSTPNSLIFNLLHLRGHSKFRNALHGRG